ncbi:hypothetical protein [Variovorax sp. DXTD-1]|uniref:hypothetical protein n=1 Tax=Variovorax sp. DXTD-1 TaxID=2495592 RepID=UPI000F8901AD|nr:hypothetical protein [Variovorax sp. DXTD-1]RST52523.1 hypothetical protein EJI00_06880 [Variovorax sp. DXTD-1]
MSEFAGILVLVAVLCLCAYVVISGQAFERKVRGVHADEDRRIAELLATGVPMRARILSVSDTGTRLRPHHIRAAVRLLVHESDGTERELSGLISIPPLRIPMLVPGREVVARVDPITKEFVVDYGKE